MVPLGSNWLINQSSRENAKLSSEIGLHHTYPYLRTLLPQGNGTYCSLIWDIATNCIHHITDIHLIYLHDEAWKSKWTAGSRDGKDDKTGLIELLDSNLMTFFNNHYSQSQGDCLVVSMSAGELFPKHAWDKFVFSKHCNGIWSVLFWGSFPFSRWVLDKDFYPVWSLLWLTYLNVRNYRLSQCDTKELFCV